MTAGSRLSPRPSSGFIERDSRERRSLEVGRARSLLRARRGALGSPGDIPCAPRRTKLLEERSPRDPATRISRIPRREGPTTSPTLPIALARNDRSVQDERATFSAGRFTGFPYLLLSPQLPSPRLLLSRERIELCVSRARGTSSLRFARCRLLNSSRSIAEAPHVGPSLPQPRPRRDDVQRPGSFIFFVMREKKRCADRRYFLASVRGKSRD